MILVTGATGFLGKKLLQHLVASGNGDPQLPRPVRALVRDPARLTPDLRFDNVEWIQGDVLDVVSLEEAMQGVTHVYHCAAVVSFDASDHKTMMQVNAIGTANTVNAALASGVKKMLHVSSTAALGRQTQSNMIDENAVWKKSPNNSVYALSKYLAEREVWRGTQEGLPAVIVNPSVIIGPGDWNRGTPRLFHASRRGMPAYPRGTNAFVSVHDVVICMVELMNGNFENERFVLTAENVSYRDFFTWVTQTLGVKTPTVSLPKWSTEITWRLSALLHKTLGVYPLLTRETARTVNGTFHYSNEKIKQRLGYNFTPAKQFISDTALAYKQSMSGRS